MPETVTNETQTRARELLRQTKVSVAPDTFVLVGLTHEAWTQVLSDPALSPRGDAIFMLLRDAHEVTLLLTEEDWQTMRHGARDARVEKDFRLLTFELELDWQTVGFLAEVTRLLAAENISLGALTAFSRDHLLIKQADLPRALRALGEVVAELC